MTKVLWSSFQQLFDDYGDPLNGGTIDSFIGGTSTPKATYTDSTGNTAEANPIVLDAAGRETGGIWVNPGEAYKFVLKNSVGSTIDTLDNVVVGTAATTSTSDYEVACSFVGTPGAQAIMAVHQMVRTVTFPVNFDGADASVGTNPAATYAVSIKNNGVEVGTVTFDTAGVPTFATTGGTTFVPIFGDRIAFVAPDSGSASDFGITLVGAL